MEDSKYIRIPEKVLRHKTLTAGAKLLYGEIEALCKQKGFCRKQNQEFAELYGVSVGTVSVWINSLKETHFIKCRFPRKYERCIFLGNIDNKTIKQLTKNRMPINEKPKDYTTYNKGEHFEDVPPTNISVETKIWKDSKGQIHGEDSIDYENRKEI